MSLPNVLGVWRKAGGLSQRRRRDLFVANDAAEYLKPQRGGTNAGVLPTTQRIRAGSRSLPTELGRSFRWTVSITISLLTELGDRPDGHGLERFGARDRDAGSRDGLRNWDDGAKPSTNDPSRTDRLRGEHHLARGGSHRQRVGQRGGPARRWCGAWPR